MLRAISELTTDLVYVKDRDSRLVFANAATLRTWSPVDYHELARRPAASGPVARVA
jgi:hypothetical protein